MIQTEKEFRQQIQAANNKGAQIKASAAASQGGGCVWNLETVMQMLHTTVWSMIPSELLS